MRRWPGWKAAPTCTGLGAELAALSFRAWFFACLALEGVRRCLAWWDAAERVAPPQTVALLGYTIARMGYREADLRMRGAIERAVEHYRTLGDRERLYDALNYASHIACGRGDVAAAERLLAEARGLEDPAWLPRSRAVRCNSEAAVLMFRGDHAATIAWYDVQRACYESDVGHRHRGQQPGARRSPARPRWRGDRGHDRDARAAAAGPSSDATYSLKWLLPLVVALVHSGRIDEGGPAGEASIQALQQGGALGVGLTASCLLAGEHWHEAARTIGCADATVEQRGIQRWAYWQQRRQRAQQQLEAALDAALLGRCWPKGPR